MRFFFLTIIFLFLFFFLMLENYLLPNFTSNVSVKWLVSGPVICYSVQPKRRSLTGPNPFLGLQYVSCGDNFM